eukprot:m.238459 g.238459  ORF g.238459 m.238459 type:complete len:82 (-) comp33722_c3_seq1:182-427(-)
MSPTWTVLSLRPYHHQMALSHHRHTGKAVNSSTALERFEDLECKEGFTTQPYNLNNGLGNSNQVYIFKLQIPSVTVCGCVV